MPELPEVETTRRGVEPWVYGQQITDLVVRNPDLRWPVRLPHDLIGAKIDSVQRRGKYLLFMVSQGAILIHLGMSGSLRVVPCGDPPRKHDHVDIVFGQRCIRLNDPRRFGCVLHIEQDVWQHPLLRDLGVEPLGNEFSGEWLFARSRNRKVAVKNFIMDSKQVVGVGNIYAAESLFSAGIRPTVQARRVSLNAYQTLAGAIRSVLSRAISRGGTTLRDFVNSQGNPGYFQQELFVYGRDGEPCRICETVLKAKQIGQRSSVYCPKCQTFQAFRPPI